MGWFPKLLELGVEKGFHQRVNGDPLFVVQVFQDREGVNQVQFNLSASCGLPFCDLCEGLEVLIGEEAVVLVPDLRQALVHVRSQDAVATSGERYGAG